MQIVVLSFGLHNPLTRKATQISLLILTRGCRIESIKESASAIGRTTSMCSFGPVDLSAYSSGRDRWREFKMPSDCPL
jgi:hypothetical protein